LNDSDDPLKSKKFQMQGTHVGRNGLQLLVRRLGRAPLADTSVSSGRRSQSMTEDAVQRSRWTIFEVVKG
jgi:hypothetical protein